jgi:hypothetical protein
MTEIWLVWVPDIPFAALGKACGNDDRLRVSVAVRNALPNQRGARLETLGERESGTAGLEEAVAADRDALKEYTRERVPLDRA